MRDNLPIPDPVPIFNSKYIVGTAGQRPARRARASGPLRGSDSEVLEALRW